MVLLFVVCWGFLVLLCCCGVLFLCLFWLCLFFLVCLVCGFGDFGGVLLERGFCWGFKIEMMGRRWMVEVWWISLVMGVSYCWEGVVLFVSCWFWFSVCCVFCGV